MHKTKSIIYDSEMYIAEIMQSIYTICFYSLRNWMRSKLKQNNYQPFQKEFDFYFRVFIHVLFQLYIRQYIYIMPPFAILNHKFHFIRSRINVFVYYASCALMHFELIFNYTIMSFKFPNLSATTGFYICDVCKHHIMLHIYMLHIYIC